ncbi:hypothetical protein GCM10010269_10690 [Streptomyces humidus]|uniref:Uncharacterized protein n=1 Tax=Streptomyces humidus TaxID=52259 RepID=A0A918FRP1_9ACTN|nr:hypothetical protein [Streptomyces humidus]GGR73609.1 hypothetical protein GCM10010269_10690 [Streptomyces humidus]
MAVPVALSSVPLLPLLPGAAASCRSAAVRWSATGREPAGDPSAARETGTVGPAPSREGEDEGEGEGEGVGEGAAARWTAVGRPSTPEGAGGVPSAVVDPSEPAAVAARGPGAGSSAVVGPALSAPVARPEACAAPVSADGAAVAARAGSVRRWTGVDVDLVNGAGSRAGGGAAGDTRMPRAGETAAGRDVCAGRAATTGTSGGAGAVATDGRADALDDAEDEAEGEENEDEYEYDDDGPGAPAGPSRSGAGPWAGAGSSPGAVGV